MRCSEVEKGFSGDDEEIFFATSGNYEGVGWICRRMMVKVKDTVQRMLYHGMGKEGISYVGVLPLTER